MTENVSGAPCAIAGADVEAGDRVVKLFALIAKKATRSRIYDGFGGFTGLFVLGNYEKPLLATSSDGVGTKLVVAQVIGKHGIIGLDLVAIVVDDLIVHSAEPPSLQDYITIGKVVSKHVTEIISGITEGCVQAGCALLGDEIAEHPGMMEPDEYDASVIGIDAVEEDKLLGPDRVHEGDAIIAMESSGPHPNGYSLVHYALLGKAGPELGDYVRDFGRTLGGELLELTKTHTEDCLALTNGAEVRIFCHVTGGGLAGNMVHIMPGGLTVDISRAIWTLGPIFKTIAEFGNVSREEMEKTFNMSVGMVAIVSAEDRDRTLAPLIVHHVNAWELDIVHKSETGEDGIVLRGSHLRF